MLGIKFPDSSKLCGGAILVKKTTFAMTQAFSRVSSLMGALVVWEPHCSLNSSKGTLYSVECFMEGGGYPTGVKSRWGSGLPYIPIFGPSG